MKVVIAIDSFKGCLTSKEANEAAAEGIRNAYPEAEIVEVPVSDGGEGYMEAFHAAIGGRLEVTMCLTLCEVRTKERCYFEHTGSGTLCI